MVAWKMSHPTAPTQRTGAGSQRGGVPPPRAPEMSIPPSAAECLDLDPAYDGVLLLRHELDLEPSVVHRRLERTPASRQAPSLAGIESLQDRLPLHPHAEAPLTRPHEVGLREVEDHPVGAGGERDAVSGRERFPASEPTSLPVEGIVVGAGDLDLRVGISRLPLRTQRLPGIEETVPAPRLAVRARVVSPSAAEGFPASEPLEEPADVLRAVNRPLRVGQWARGRRERGPGLLGSAVGGQQAL